MISLSIWPHIALLSFSKAELILCFRTCSVTCPAASTAVPDSDKSFLDIKTLSRTWPWTLLKANPSCQWSSHGMRSRRWESLLESIPLQLSLLRWLSLWQQLTVLITFRLRPTCLRIPWWTFYLVFKSFKNRWMSQIQSFKKQDTIWLRTGTVLLSVIYTLLILQTGLEAFWR